MKPLYKLGAYLTAAVHTVYLPMTLYYILQHDPGPTAIVNFGVCTTGVTVGFFIDHCPLTFVEKWFRRRYDAAWVFEGGWVQYYCRLVLSGLSRTHKAR